MSFSDHEIAPDGPIIKKRKVIASFTIDEKELKDFQNYAQKHQMSMSQLIRVSLSSYVEQRCFKRLLDESKKSDILKESNE